ncbi:tumor necrosis factor ligand superfamily member 10 isoform X2 [Empidonax traillii]|uniref:tumor necrosis factor ligand superfamily member 10 isoform X2 n=1 Tax=Empidonax traillii TaxID=164674 RepID=UPI000FFD0D54|nr:tumor necrosis factor ligand superfamily member 10 isoform X2 [Empidonax traillii]
MLAPGGPSPALTCGAVVVAAVLLQSACVAVTFLYFTSELKQLQDTYSKSGIACLTGEEIGNSIQNLEEIESEDREADPCWQVKWHLGKLIKKMMSKSFEENISAINAERTLALSHTDRQQQPRGPIHRVAAHLTGSNNRRSSLSTRYLLPRRGIGHKINWESSRKTHSFLYNVELRNGELVIPQTGFYYIYSQIYFRFRENENEDSDVLGQIRNPKQLVQYIYRLTNYPEPILLMKSARTSCWSKKAEYGLYSTYQGGVFQLKREDRIFVSVSNSDLVDMDKEASFFGAFMIG